MVCAILLSIGSTAQATRTWVSGNTGNWSNTANWSGNVLPSSAETAQVNNGNCTVDSSQLIGQLLMGGGATDVGVLNIGDSAVTLTVGKGSAEIFGMLKTSGATATVYQSAGKVVVYGTGSSAGKGETRLVTGSSITSGSSTYNLSGGTLDTEVLSKGLKTANATFNATGGTLVIRNQIYRFGTIAEGLGFNQGTCTLEIGAVDNTAAIILGNATNLDDYTVGTGGTIDIDIASDFTYDTILQNGNVANIAGATMNIDLLYGYTPVADSFFDVWTFADKSKAGSGSVVGLPTGWAANWVDTNSDLSKDTLRLTYTPEPVTIALLGLGFLAIRRNKK
jgi:hypothetical protein